MSIRAKFVVSGDPGGLLPTDDLAPRGRARASLFPRLLATALLLATSGCALQLSTGWSSTSTKLHPVPRVVAFEARAFKPRHNGPLFGLAVQAGLGESAANPVRIRTGLLAGGYHFRTVKRFPRGVGFEPVFELGVGQPALLPLNGTGGYLGAGATVLYRLGGPGDDEPRFDTLTVLTDLALTLRGGLWTAPEDPRPLYVPEASVQLGLRITFSSDLTAPRTRENPGETPDLPGTPGVFR